MTTLDPATPSAARRPGFLSIVAAASLLLAGLSLAAYALTGLTTRDWTIAGPGLLVAAAGVAGLRNRWFHLAGLAPIGAVLSIAGPILAYDLARPDETGYFIGSVAIIVGGCLAAIFGTVAALTSARRALVASMLGVLVATPIAFVTVINGNPASAATDNDISDTERRMAVDVEMVDYAFVVDPQNLTTGQVVHLRNTGSLPHDFSIVGLDFAVFVPPGRTTYLRLPESGQAGYHVICTVGDHLDRGMHLDPVPASP